MNVVRIGINRHRREYRVYPFALCRVAGQSFDALQSLDSVVSLKLGAELDGNERQLEKRRGEMERAFRQAIGESIDPAQRRALIAGARNLRRRSKLSATQVTTLLRAGSQGLAHAFERWRSANKKIGEISQHLETTYDDELQASRRALRVLAQDSQFLAGLVLARPALYNNFSQSLDMSFDEISFNRSQRRMERALVKYFTRSAAKTTPFSTFVSTVPTHIVRSTSVPAHIVHSTGTCLIVLPRGDSPRSVVTLNKVLYSLLYRSYLKDTPDLYHCFAVSLNPSLQRNAEDYEMLVARDGREQLVRLPAVPAIELAVVTLSGYDGTMGYTELVRQLGSDLQVGVDETGRRVERMIEVGLLQLNSSIPDYEPDWAPLLRAKLEKSTHPRAATVRRILDQAERVRTSFAAASAERRWTLLRRARRQLKGVVPSSGNAVAGRTREDHRARSGEILDRHMRQMLELNPVYEDTFFPEPALVSRERLWPALEALARWIDWMRLLSLDWSAHANLREHFNRAFPDRAHLKGPDIGHTDATCNGVPFLTFYKSFYAEVYEDFERYEKGPRTRPFAEIANPYGLTGFDLATRAADRLCEVVNRLWATAPNSESLHLSQEHFAEAVGDGRMMLEELCSSGAISIAVFTQLLSGLPTCDADALLVDQQYVHPGMGKFFSRFLHLFDSQIAENLQTHNFRRRDCLVAELCDDSEFSYNANLHPPLAAYEINYPANLSGLQPQTNLSLSALDVTPDPDNSHRLKLVYRQTGQEVLPVNAGFLSPLRRPAIFRVLELFSPVFRHRFRIPWHNPALQNPRQQHLPQELSGVTAADIDSVVYRPRVVFERRVVLSRRAWKVPADLLWHMTLEVSQACAFRRLNCWRRSLGMPRHVFFTLAPPTRPNKAEKKRLSAGRRPGSRVTRPRYRSKKPQYLSFGSGMLSQLLFDVAKDHGGDVVFEEMLPTPEMLACRNGRSYATEFVLQLDGKVIGCG